MKTNLSGKSSGGGDDLSHVYIGVHLNLGSNPKKQKMLK
jgi:hypothetical protein